MQELKDEIDKLCARCSGEQSYIVKDMDAGESFGMNETLLFPAASLIKLPIMLTLFNQVRDGNLSLAERLEFREGDRVSGFGVLKDLDEGLSLTYRDLAVLMITLSDNIATNILIDRLKIENINRVAGQIGMNQTILGRKMMDAQAKEKGIDNYTCAKDIETVYQEILEHDKRAEMLDILLRQQCNNKLPVYMGQQVKFAHKTGDLPGTEHDAGVLFINGKKILIAVLTRGLCDNREGVFLNNEIGKLVYEHYKEQR